MVREETHFTDMSLQSLRKSVSFSLTQYDLEERELRDKNQLFMFQHPFLHYFERRYLFKLEPIWKTKTLTRTGTTLKTVDDGTLIILWE